MTGNANFIADSGILTTIAATPYASENSVDWEVGAFRCENTVFLFDCRYAQATDEALQEAFQLEKLRRILTKVRTACWWIRILATLANRPCSLPRKYVAKT